MSLHPTDELSIETVCDLLRDERRRHLVTVLADSDAPVSLTNLAETVAARERDAETSRLAEKTVRRTAISLHHHHLPKLDEAGVVEYDPAARTIDVAAVEGIAAQIPDN